MEYNVNHPQFEDGTFCKKNPNNLKSRRVSLMLTNDEYLQLEYFCKKKDLSYSDMIRKALSAQLFKFKDTVKKRKKRKKTIKKSIKNTAKLIR